MFSCHSGVCKVVCKVNWWKPAIFNKILSSKNAVLHINCRKKWILVCLDIGNYFLIPLARTDRIISVDNTTGYKIRLCIVRLTLDLYEHKRERSKSGGNTGLSSSTQYWWSRSAAKTKTSDFPTEVNFRHAVHSWQFDTTCQRFLANFHRNSELLRPPSRWSRPKNMK